MRLNIDLSPCHFGRDFFCRNAGTTSRIEKKLWEKFYPYPVPARMDGCAGGSVFTGVSGIAAEAFIPCQCSEISVCSLAPCRPHLGVAACISRLQQRICP